MLWSYCLQEQRFLFLIFILALIARMALFYSFLSKDENYSVYFDSAQYQAVAQSIVQGKGISNSDGSPNFYRLPGYPVFLAGCYKVFDNNLYFTLLLQIIISCLIPLLMFCLTLALFPAQLLLAKMVTLVAVFHLGFVIYAGMLATESLFTLFLLLFLIFLFSGTRSFSTLSKNYSQEISMKGCHPGQSGDPLRNNVLHWIPDSPLGLSRMTDPVRVEWSSQINPNVRNSWMLFSGLMLGIASLIRPVGHFLLPVACVLVFIAQENIGIKIKKASVLTAGWLLVVMWWLGRNWLLTGMIFFHTLPGLHFLQYSTAKVVMELRNCTYVQARGALLDEWKAKIKDQEVLLSRQLSEPEKCAIAEKITLFYCKQRPFTVIKNCMCEMVKTVFGLYSAQLIFADTQEWTDYSTSSTWSKLKKYLYPNVNTWYLIPLTWFEIIASFLLLIGFVGFCLRALFNKQLFLQVLPIFLFIGLLIGLTCAYGCARLRLPLEPLLVIISMHWWVWFYQKYCLHKKSYLEDTSCK